MKSAKSFATFTLAGVTLLISVVLPLSAYAATTITISGNGTASVTVNGETIEKNETSPEVKITTENTTPSPTPYTSTPGITSSPAAQVITSPTKTPTPTTSRLMRRMRTPTPTPTKTPTPTATKTPTPTKTMTPTPTTQTVSGSVDEKKTFIMNAINEYRRSRGLSAVRTDSYSCSFAKIRAQEITKDFSHAGFRDRINSKSLPYPRYSLVTENIAMTSDYKKVVTMWINSAGHAENMRRDTPFVCVEASGNYYAYEGYRP